MTVSSDLFDAGVRVEKIIYIPGAVTDMEATPESFSDFCEDLPEKEDSPLYTGLPALKKFADLSGYINTEDVAEALVRTNGFLVQGAAPVRQYSDDPTDTSYGWSWGHYYTAWLYASEESEIAPVVLAWAETRADYDKQRAVKK